MTHLLTVALEKHSPDWLHLGLERSYVRTVDDKQYVVVVDRSGPVAVYLVPASKRLRLIQLSQWPPEVTEPRSE